MYNVLKIASTPRKTACSKHLFKWDFLLDDMYYADVDFALQYRFCCWIGTTLCGKVLAWLASEPRNCASYLDVAHKQGQLRCSDSDFYTFMTTSWSLVGKAQLQHHWKEPMKWSVLSIHNVHHVKSTVSSHNQTANALKCKSYTQHLPFATFSSSDCSKI